MNAKPDDLYGELIRKHNDQPNHFLRPAFPSESIQAYNPVCGDKFTIYVSNGGNPLQHLAFQGIGCAISKASASMMIGLIEGKSIAEARALRALFIRYIKGDDVDIPGELKAFAGIRKFPERFECAALPWSALDAFLAAHNSHEN